MNELGKFLTTEQAAQFLGVARRTLEKRRVIGGGPRFRKFGRSVRYAIEDLREFADRDVRTSTSDPGGQAV